MADFIKNILNPIFYNVLYMSVIGIVVGIFILVFRKILDKKISPKWKCIMWFLLLISLVIPFKFKIKTDNKNMQPLSISGLASPIQNAYDEENNISYSQENIEIKEISNDLKVNENETINDVKLETDYRDITLHIIIPLIWSIGALLSIILLIKGNRSIKNKIKSKSYNDKNIKGI